MRVRVRGTVLVLTAAPLFAVACGQIAGIAQLTLAPPSDGGPLSDDGSNDAPDDTSMDSAGPIMVPDSGLSGDATAGDAMTDSGHATDGAMSGDAAPDSMIHDPVVTVSGGFDHACALTKSGRVLCWGSNDMDQLGHSPTLDVTCTAEGTGPCNPNPTLVNDSTGKPLVGVKKVSAGWDVSCALLADAAVACWGSNVFGRLGHDPSGDLSCSGEPCNPTPVNVAGLTGVADIGTSDITPDVCAATMSGVVCWGYNYDGVFGNGASCVADAAVAETWVPTASLVMGATDSVAIGTASMCVAATDGGVLCAGSNAAGQLGHEWEAGVPPDQVDSSGGPCNGTPQRVKGLIPSTALVAGDGFECSLGTDESISCWGLNYYGTLGLGPPDEYEHPGPATITGLTAVQVSARLHHACARNSAGAIHCWGANDFGELGNGTVGTAGPDAGSCLMNQTCVDGTPTLLSGLPVGITSVTAGFGTSYAVTADGGVLAWGFNDRGQLGHDAGSSGDVPCDTSLAGFCSASPHAVAGLPPPM